MAERVTVTLPAYQWEEILRGLASSGWDSMHAILTAELAKPQPADPVRCPKCGGPHPFHDPACVVHPDLIQDQANGRSER